MDYEQADCVYELWLHKETQEVWAVRLTHGHLTGTLDVTYDDPRPTNRDLPTLDYGTPEKGDEARAEHDKHLWIVTGRFTRFVSAVPPQWVLDRQTTTQRDALRDAAREDRTG